MSYNGPMRTKSLLIIFFFYILIISLLSYTVISHTQKLESYTKEAIKYGEKNSGLPEENLRQRRKEK